jgi:hypothetical protein
MAWLLAHNSNVFQIIWLQIGNFITNVWESIKITIRMAINSVIALINGMINRLNDTIKGFSDAMKSLPGGQAINFRVGNIPMLEKGGVVSSPTLAVLGESGKEVVAPLENNTGWINDLAEKINMTNAGQSNGQTIVVKLGEEKIYEKFITFVNEQTLVTNTTVLNI